MSESPEVSAQGRGRPAGRPRAGCGTLTLVRCILRAAGSRIRRQGLRSRRRFERSPAGPASIPPWCTTISPTRPSSSPRPSGAAPTRPRRPRVAGRPAGSRRRELVRFVLDRALVPRRGSQGRSACCAPPSGTTRRPHAPRSSSCARCSTASLPVVDADDAELRADLAASQVVGIMVPGYVLRIEPLASAPIEELVARSGRCMQWHLIDYGPRPGPDRYGARALDGRRKNGE